VPLRRHGTLVKPLAVTAYTGETDTRRRCEIRETPTCV